MCGRFHTIGLACAVAGAGPSAAPPARRATATSNEMTRVSVFINSPFAALMRSIGVRASVDYRAVMHQPRLLDGIRVLDAASFIAGPVATTVMADFGADVVKIEPPGGDSY